MMRSSEKRQEQGACSAKSSCGEFRVSVEKTFFFSPGRELLKGVKLRTHGKELERVGTLFGDAF